MSSLEGIVAAQNTLESLMTLKFAEFESILKTTSPHSDTISGLKLELDKFREVMFAMVKLIRQQISALNNSVDNIEMRHRRKYILFVGVPEKSDENAAHIISNICQSHLQLAEASPSCFPICHRLGPAAAGRSRPILVRCDKAGLKEAIWKKKTALKGSSIAVAEFLTRERQAIFLDARKYYGMRNVWSLEGTIFIKVPTGGVHRVVTAEQLRKVMSEHPCLSPPSPHAGQTTVEPGPSSAKDVVCEHPCPSPSPSSSHAEQTTTEPGPSSVKEGHGAGAGGDTVKPVAAPATKKPSTESSSRPSRRAKAPAEPAIPKSSGTK